MRSSMTGHAPAQVEAGKWPAGCALRISFLTGEVNMSPMTKVRGYQPVSEPAMKVRRKRAVQTSDPNEPFIRAFVDALRDILHDETGSRL
jgi:hypothetical protein